MNRLPSTVKGMLTIRRMAESFGLSRSTLLYYDRLGLLCPSGRSAAGYRLYSKADAERLALICSYRNAGLALSTIQTLLDADESTEANVLRRRIRVLDREIETIRVKQKILLEMLYAKAEKVEGAVAGEGARQREAAEALLPDRRLWGAIMADSGMDQDTLRMWHARFECRSPEAHHSFLRWLGLSERECHQIRYITKSVEENDAAMKYFNLVFHGIPRQGPGTPECTARAWRMIAPALPVRPRVMDIGCGSGGAALVLAGLGDVNVTALDIDQELLRQLVSNARMQGVEERITPMECSMSDIPDAGGGYDVVWSEGAAFIMGVENALRDWRRLLRPKGFLVLTELVWFDADPHPEVLAYMNEVYPPMRSREGMMHMAAAEGYTLEGTFDVPDEGWTANYYDPMDERLDALETQYQNVPEAVQMFATLRKEVEMYRKYGGAYGYTFFVLRKPD